MENLKENKIILSILAFMIIIIFNIIYRLGFEFKPIATIQYKGYAVSGKELIENLLKKDLNAERTIEALKVDEDSEIYKKVSTYYIGKDKKAKINLDYPIYVNQNSTLLNMSDNGKLITTDFAEFEIYENSALTEGNLYNIDTLERADYNDYLFLKNSDNIFINSKELQLQTNMNTYTIPQNSIISFTEDYIVYYYLEENEFVFKSILDIDLTSNVSISKVGYTRNNEKNQMDSISTLERITYKELLTKLKLRKDPIVKEIPEEKSKIIEDNSDNEKVKDVEENNNQNVKIPWIKPVVKIEKFESEIYTASSILNIYDPSSVIKSSINFEIYKDNKIYMRTPIISSGRIRLGVLEPNTEYRIIGSYRYSTEDNKTIEVQLVDEKIKTKDINELATLKLKHEIGQIYSDKIEIKNLKIDSNLSDVSETLIGIKKAEIILNKRKFEIKTSDLRRILNGQEVTFESGTNLKSNSEINFEIKFYDIVNNEIKLENNKGITKTCKKNPSVDLLNISNESGIDISVKIKDNNPDNVDIKNLNYAVYSVNNDIVDSNSIDSDIINLRNLEFSKYYVLEVYGDYDINDNLGEKKKQLLGTLTLSTVRLDSFGELYIDSYNRIEDLTQYSNKFTFSINTTVNKTNLELIKMLSEICIIVSDSEEEVQRKYLTSEELRRICNLEEIDINLEHLESNTYYKIKIEAIASAGKESRNLTAIINGAKTFTTLKEEAKVNIKNLFILNNMIDFDINILDIDTAVRQSKVNLEVISSKGEVVYSGKINTSIDINDYQRIQIQSLSPNEKYYIKLLADRYSVRLEEATIKPKTFEFNGNEARISNEKKNDENVGIIYTNEVGGSILLQKYEKEATSQNKNLVDVDSNINWYSECFNTDKGYLKEYREDDEGNGILKLGVGDQRANSKQIYIYDILSSLPNYREDSLEISFKYKKSNSDLKMYLQKGKNLSSDVMYEITSNQTEYDDNDELWYVFNSNITQNDIKTNRYIGFQLVGSDNQYVEIKELQIKLKESEGDEHQDLLNEYEKFQYNMLAEFKFNLNLYDEKLEKLGYNNNVTEGKYYIRVNNITDSRIEEILYTDYDERAQQNVKNLNCIENSILNLNLEQNKAYEIELLLKNPNIAEREYVLNTIEVNTNLKEIKNISTVQEYLTIQPNGSYIFSNDINLEDGDYKFGNDKIFYNGTLDFNGKTVKRKITLKEDQNYKYYLFYGISEIGKIKNLYFDFSIDIRNVDGRTDLEVSPDNSGLVYINRGNISNLIVNLSSSTNSPNQKFAIIGHDNVGTLENFVIYLKSHFYLGNNGALGFVNCTGGVIKNGYISSYPDTSYSIKPIECYSDVQVNIGGLSAITTNSEIENIYSLVTIHSDNQVEFMDNISGLAEKVNAGNLLGKIKDSTIKNIYSVGMGNVTERCSQNGLIGPTISYKYDADDKNHVQNCYFFYEGSLNNNEYNTKVNTAALSNEEFQNNLLNANEKQFIINNTIKEYFPQVRMSDVMPAQLKIPMITPEETDADILLVKVLEDGDTEKSVEFTIYNPGESKIDKIEIEGLEVDKYRLHDDKYCINENIAEKCVGHDSEGYCIDSNGSRLLVEENGYTQDYISGQTTKLITKVKIPQEEIKDQKGFDARQYNSKYLLKTVKARGYLEKRYIDENNNVQIRNEIKLVYYCQINNIDEWKRINEYPDENYRIVNNLDFQNTEYNVFSITNKFTGIIDGKKGDGLNNIVTISNVGTLETPTKLPLIAKVDKGTIKNLSIDGFYQQIDTTGTTVESILGGLIDSTTKGTIIDNVHVKNVKLVTKTKSNDTHKYNIGGLIANSDGTKISNSSVSYIKSKPNISDLSSHKLSEATIGGIIGEASETEIINCYVRNISVKMDLGISNGIGGIVGNYTGKIENSYAIGEVKTNSQNIGGIFGTSLKVMITVDGETKKAPNICSNCYACVNIKTDSTEIGGIGGFVAPDSQILKELKENVSIGNLYTSMSNVQINRVYGNISENKLVNASYSFSNQLINGVKNSRNIGATFLFNEANIIDNKYNNYVLFKKDIYDINDLKELYLPKLKYINSNEYLPNQAEENMEFPKNPILEIISAEKERDTDKIKVRIKDTNTPSVNTANISLEISNFENVTVDRNTSFDKQNKIHTIYISSGTPVYYLDSYEITKIIVYKDNSRDIQSETETTVKIDYPQYKEINSLEEWAKEFCSDCSEYNYSKDENDGKLKFLPDQNYRITGNIDFKNTTNHFNVTINGNEENLIIPTRLEVGRLIGPESSNVVISNCNLQGSGDYLSIFKTISKEIVNISFENINIVNNGSANYAGIITKSTAQRTKNVEFNNITINASLSNYIGPIGYSKCTNVDNITADTIVCNGNNYVGGIMALTYPGNVTNVTGNNIHIISNQCAAGIFAYVYHNQATSFGNNISNISLTNSIVEGNGWTGGISGQGFALRDLKVENVKIIAKTGNQFGGVFGRQQSTPGLSNISNIYAKNIEIEVANGCGYYIGGITGYQANAFKNIYLYGIRISARNQDYIAGISGISYNNISGAIIDGNNENEYNKIIGKSYTGGITGYTTSTIEKSSVKNINITGNTYVGGILGGVYTGVVKYSYSQDCTVSGNSNVGGIVGAGLSNNSAYTNGLHVIGTYNNNIVTATTKNTGGIIGSLDNSKMTNQRYINNIYNNIVAGTEISAPQYVGSMIGKLEKPILQTTDNTRYYYGNLIVSNIDTQCPIGNINEINTETYTTIDPETNEEIIVTKEITLVDNLSRLNNTLRYKYEIENSNKVLSQEELTKLTTGNTYSKELEFSTSYFDYTNTTKYAKIKNIANNTIGFLDGTTHIFEQTGIDLPGIRTGAISNANRVMTFFAKLNTSIKYDAYVVDVNKINIEFENTNENMSFKYEYGDYVSQEIPINNRVYTFEYDFVTPLKIDVNGIEKIINPESVANRVEIIDGDYYSIKDNKLYNGINKVNDMEVVNIYNEKALTSEGKIYNLKTQAMEEKITKGIHIEEKSIPLAEYIYNEKLIETYYNFSKIKTQQEENISNYQMFLKNGKLYVLDGTLNTYADSVIINSYNNKEYQSVLGEDCKIYDLKEKLNYPENFKNEDILQMTNNIKTDDNEILIMYKDGNVYAFNYITGQVLLDTANVKEENVFTSLISKVGRLLTPKEDYLYKPAIEEYNEAINLQEILKEKSIEDAEKEIMLNEGNVETSNVLVNDNTVTENIANKNNQNESTASSTQTENNIYSNENKQKGYVTVYNPNSNEYLVYKTSTLMNSTKENEDVISETEIINMNPKLKKFYESANTVKTKNSVQGIYLVLTTIGIVGVILVFMYKKERYK